ncbi:putative cysteine-rich receptor-like protein kinase 35 isoform X2 [Cucurbita maxima]|uniref:Cysteine-rich receptor-like protein kinase 35 isoform X2 n=1 Tax=Cucurbita maxima TaxID=3661 RepID=A0A6J1JKM9_CUCMA|nr:putative cysteine-rich receptor-like protein kinase 35 isoform X2 [Cucurbita maxima]
MTKSKSMLHNLMRPFRFGSSRDSQGEDDLEQIAANEKKFFRFETLVEATNNFHPTNKLGQGGFGPVFKGKLKDGRVIAVKKLSQYSKQGKKEFMTEAKLLARVQHRNVVNLLGYCVHGSEKLLVYEYVTNESLDKLLFKASRRGELDWKMRYGIICGVARGLQYLHVDSHNVIIHRDIKAGNVLLDDKWVPKIADFGMARLFPEDQTHVNTRVSGTNGYMAPEYVMHGHLSAKADVFSFGVLVLELISGQRNSLSSGLFPDAENLLDWAYKLYKKGRSMEIMDPTLASSADPDQVTMCIQIGLLCTQGDPHLRPTMPHVVLTLSRRPGTLEEPTRPGMPGSRYRRTRRTSVSSSNAGTSGASDSYASTTNTTGTITAAATATANEIASGSSSVSQGYVTRRKTITATENEIASGSSSVSQGYDTRGKRPMEG